MALETVETASLDMEDDCGTRQVLCSSIREAEELCDSVIMKGFVTEIHMILTNQSSLSK